MGGMRTENYGHLDKDGYADGWGEAEGGIPIPPGSLEMEEPETILGEGITIRGELSFQRFIRVDGQVEGTVHAEGGKVFVGPTGVICADLTLAEAIIEGRVEGNLLIDRLELRQGASVKGDIRARTLSVEEGVEIDGKIQIGVIGPPARQEEPEEEAFAFASLESNDA